MRNSIYTYWKQGCYSAVVDYFETYIYMAGALAIVVLTIEVRLWFCFLIIKYDVMILHLECDDKLFCKNYGLWSPPSGESKSGFAMK